MPIRCKYWMAVIITCIDCRVFGAMSLHYVVKIPVETSQLTVRGFEESQGL